jgi:DnaJ family protein C protein 7
VLTEALRNDPDDAVAAKLLRLVKKGETLKEQGNAAFKAGKSEEALAAYSSALELDVRNKVLNSKLHCNMAAVLQKAGKMDEAIAACDASIALDGSYVKAFLRRAQASVAVGTVDSLSGAVRDYSRAKELLSAPAATPSASSSSSSSSAAAAAAASRGQTPAISAENQATLREVEAGLKVAHAALKKAKKKDYYKLLEIDRHADDDAIKKAYKKAALKWHPDRHSNDSEADQKRAEAIFKDITGERLPLWAPSLARGRGSVCASPPLTSHTYPPSDPPPYSSLPTLPLSFCRGQPGAL